MAWLHYNSCSMLTVSLRHWATAGRHNYMWPSRSIYAAGTCSHRVLSISTSSSSSSSTNFIRDASLKENFRAAKHMHGPRHPWITDYLPAYKYTQNNTINETTTPTGGLTMSHTEFVRNDDWREILNSCNRRCTIVVHANRVVWWQDTLEAAWPARTVHRPKPCSTMYNQGRTSASLKMETPTPRQNLDSKGLRGTRTPHDWPPLPSWFYASSSIDDRAMMVWTTWPRLRLQDKTWTPRDSGGLQGTPRDSRGLGLHTTGHHYPPGSTPAAVLITELWWCEQLVQALGQT